MQPPRNNNSGSGSNIPAAPRLPPRNPLLSLAEAPFSLEDIAPVRLVPVTPATPAVLQDEPEPIAEPDSFLGQPPQHPTPPISSASPSHGFQASPQAQPAQQPQKQSYFTSILSSLPSLSLSSITGQDDSRPKQSPVPSNPSPSGYGGYGGYGQQEIGIDFQAGSPGYSTPPYPPQQQPQPLQSPPPLHPPPTQPPPTQLPPTQPPPAFPPSGGASSYRLGNQRRLKYAPPPDLTSTQQHYQPPPAAFPAQPNLTSAPPTFFNPNVQPSSTIQPSPSVQPSPFSPLGQSNLSKQPSLFNQPNPNSQPSPFDQPNNPITQASPIAQLNLNPQPNSNIQASPYSQLSSNPQTVPVSASIPYAQSSPYHQQSSTSQPSPYYSPSNPGTQSSLPFGAPPTVPVSGPPSSQGSSLHSSFRSSPVAAPAASYGSAPPPTSSFPQSPPFGSQSQPQAIPSRLPEPATPQNTPADVAFSGFSAYRQQQQLQHHQESSSFGFASESLKPVGQLEAIQEVGVPTSDRTFSPISAAKVTEKLENLIAAEQSDDTLSVKSELSAEVAKITAGIAEPGKERIPGTEELTEIDLNSSENADSLAQSEQNASFSAPEDLTTKNHEEPPKDAYQLNFFNSPEVNLPPEDQSVPSFYNPTSFQQQQQPLSDPFSFVQSPANPLTNTQQSPSDTAAVVDHPQDLRAALNKPQAEPPKVLNFGENVSLTSSSIWGLDNQSQQTEATILNPAFSTPTQQQFQQQQKPPSPAAPTFFNPVQFTQSPAAYSVPNPPSASSQLPATISAFNNSSSSNSSTPSSTQLPPSVYAIPSQNIQFNALPEPTGSATLSPVQMSVSPLSSRLSQETVPPSLQNLAAGLPEKQMQYRPVYHHWFYRREVESKTLWLPFSMHDSLNIEEVHNSNEISPETKVATDGGRFDVEILRRSRAPVYWTGSTTEVRRCSWFYKGPAESRYTPYEESVAARLEEEFKQACTSNNWNRRVELNNGEYIIFHGPTVQAHYLQATTPELAASWGNNSGSEDNAYLQGSTSRPRIVKRGMDEFNIDEGEPEKVDHILFLVHGIGSVCDLKFRSVEEVVDEFRSIALQLVQSHYRSSSEQGLVNRIEVLPVSWHATLHSGIDKKLQVITLESIPKWRHFTNDTLLDILFYTSPVYCETIMQTVGTELNRLYSLFNQRNPDFCGNVYLGGHSLGSLIVFDLLCHQKPAEEEELETNGRFEDGDEKREDSSSMKPLAAPVMRRKLSKKISYVMGAAGTGQPFINYPQLAFAPRAFFALGSPIGMFVTVRGIDNLGDDFALPTCPAFFNIFHPFDPVAYRVESLINTEAHKYRPMLIPHHKGRKRMHLELKETMARVGADLKQKLLESVRNTWNSVYQLAMFHKQDNQTLEEEIEKVVEEQMNNPCNKSSMESTNHEDSGAELKIGKLNGGRRVDYVLQEAPFEYINEYIFAMTSHVCYWESEDTMLLILKEIYGSMGIQTDAQLPQQSLSIERVSTPTMSAASSSVVSPSQSYGMDPTAPISSKPVGPPPTMGFVRKS